MPRALKLDLRNLLLGLFLDYSEYITFLSYWKENGGWGMIIQVCLYADLKTFCKYFVSYFNLWYL